MNIMYARAGIFLGIAFINLASCGSKTASSENSVCPDHMYRYVSSWSGWSACLPRASDLVIDTADAGPNDHGPEIQGAPNIFKRSVRAKALEQLNEWIRSGAHGVAPVDPADTAMLMRSFTMYTTPLDSFASAYYEIYYDQTLDEQKKGKERSLNGKRAFSPEESWPEDRVTTVVNRYGKGFVRTIQYGVYSDTEKGSLAIASLTVEHYSKDRTFTFQGTLATRDTTCRLECLEKDSTIILYDRIVDSIDW